MTKFFYNMIFVEFLQFVLNIVVWDAFNGDLEWSFEKEDFFVLKI
jgi:hypothetical protein